MISPFSAHRRGISASSTGCPARAFSATGGNKKAQCAANRRKTAILAHGQRDADASGQWCAVAPNSLRWVGQTLEPHMFALCRPGEARTGEELASDQRAGICGFREQKNRRGAGCFSFGVAILTLAQRLVWCDMTVNTLRNDLF